MQKWEYAADSVTFELVAEEFEHLGWEVDDRKDYDNQIERFRVRGIEGWELVSVVAHDTNGALLYFFWKRPLL